ncbi:MAG: GNAT family N-acetyltransferase [Clostridium perfringens]|nr:GNAT family N-acetyltransferase [Clostridium perfringens]
MEFLIKHFNELKIDELYEIVKSRFEVFAMEQKIIDEQDFDDKDRLCYHGFFRENGRVIAYGRIVLKGLSYDECSIGRVLVLKSYRRQGMAKKLLENLIKYINEELKEEGIIISAQVYAKDLYESVGFKECGEVYDEVNIPHIKMRFNLGEGK